MLAKTTVSLADMNVKTVLLVSAVLLLAAAGKKSLRNIMSNTQR